MPRLAVLFDLDGVISDTASVHARAWRMVFDDALNALGAGHSPFDEASDYRLYVDGKMRQTGIRDFLASRGLDFPLGGENATQLDTVNGIGNTKNAIFRELIEKNGVALFEDAVHLIDTLSARGIPLGLASSSKNAKIVLEKSQLLPRFAAVMDGLVAERDAIASKPSGDFYLRAAELIGVSPAQCIVIEDAVSGVTSAKAAKVKAVVGISRMDNAAALRQSGADLVVTSLDDLPPEIFQAG